MNRNKIQLLENIKALDNSNEKLKEFLPKKNYKNLEKLEISLLYESRYRASIGGFPEVEILPALLDNSLKTKIPITLFGLTDYFGSYVASFQVLPLINPWGNNQITRLIVKFSNTVNYNYEKRGQLINIYQSSLNGGADIYTYYSNIYCNSVAYGTLLNNLSDSIYLIKSIKVVFNNANITQLDNPLLFSKQNINGKLITDSIDLKTFVLPSSFNQTIVDIPLNIILDKNLMINQYIEFDCTNIQYIFTLIKIK